MTEVGEALPPTQPTRPAGDSGLPTVIVGTPALTGAAERLARLQAVTARLAGAQTVAEVARVAVTTAASAVGSTAASVLSLSGDALRCEIQDAIGYPTETVNALRRFSVDAALPAAHAARTGEPVVLVGEDARRQRFPDLPTIGDITVHVALPLFGHGHGRTVGAITFSWGPDDPFAHTDMSFLETIAQQVGSALERARLYDASIETAQTLQRTLLPVQLPVVPGVEIAARYQPLDDSAIVGGDFYDVFRRGDRHSYGLSIGDVSGKGIEAASLTALARHTIRAASRRASSPAAVLSDLNAAVLADEMLDRYLTVAHLVLRPESMATQITIALGGHPQPLLRTADRAVRPVGKPGTAVGLFDRGQWAEEHLSLAEGNVLVLFTDGLTDVRHPTTGELAGDLIADILAASDAKDAETLADELLSAVLSFAGGARRDDIALLVVYPR